MLDLTAQSSADGRAEPYHASRLDFLRYTAQFARDRVETLRRIRRNFGPFVLCRAPAPFPRLMAFVSGERFNREIFSKTDTWQTYRLYRHYKVGHASERLAQGLIRLNSGPRQKHYRKLIAPALSRSTVKKATARMLNTAEAEIVNWPAGEATNIWDRVCQMMQSMAITTLFGNARSSGCPVAEMINEVNQEMLSLRLLRCPFNIPGTPYNHMLKRAERLERDIIDWAEAKRGVTEPTNLLSLLINSVDEQGRQPDMNSIVGYLPTLMTGSFESSQSTVFWTLLLLSQHPEIAAKLVDEIEGFDAHAVDAGAALDKLELLDHVVKEGMRLLPAVPVQARISKESTSLGGYMVPRRTYAFLSAIYTNREPEVYADPDAFLPERWETLKPNEYQYLTFSAGPRRCPGYWYGMASVKVALLSILKRFRVDFTSEIPIDHTVSLVMYPRRSAMAILRLQDQSREASSIRGKVCRLMPMAD